MEDKRRGRPPSPLDPDASATARLGAELRPRRLTQRLTLQALADLIGYSPQHVSEVERGNVLPSRPFVAACDRALAADGALLELLPPAIEERSQRCDERSAARRIAADPALRYATAHSDVGDEDVEPTNRRGLLGAGTAAALLSGLGVAAAPAAAREVDPELPAHWTNLLRLLGRYDETFGPRDVLAVARREIGLIAEHRGAARGRLRAALMRVESRWAELAAWLSEDTGDQHSRDVWTDHALRLATESGYADMIALARARQSEWTSSPHRTAGLAEDALRVPGVNSQTRAWCSRQAAVGHAIAGDTASCERRLADAYSLLKDDDSPPPPWAGGSRVSYTGTLALEARCHLAKSPRKAIGLYDDALRHWPRAEVRDGGVVRARLALACAKAGERERAEAEGREALAIARSTRSSTATRELRRLGQMLAA
jgi:transcriptional regulator with XRE-family HTH domain